MADLEKRDNHKDWLRWAIELMRRGIWADNTITVHGPHHPDAPFMWGEAWGTVDGHNYNALFKFQTASGIRGIYDIRGVTIQDEEGNQFRIRSIRELSPKAQHWLKVARAELKKL